MEIKKTESRMEKIVNQFKLYREDGDYLNHYLANCFYILVGWEKGIVDYSRISHENKLMSHRFNRMIAYAFGEL